MDKERDEELDQLLSGARKIDASKEQIEKWRAAVRRELEIQGTGKKTSVRWAGQLAAALATGFLLGALSFKQASVVEIKNEPVATVQYVFSKTE